MGESMSYTILIAENSKEDAELLSLLMSGEGYNKIIAASGKDAIEKTDETVDLVVLSLPLEGENGIFVCSGIRKKTNAPIIVLSDACGDSDKIFMFSAGADDYMTKPFSYSELGARIKALLRRYCIYLGRSSKAGGSIIKTKNIVLDTSSQLVTADGKRVQLTTIEYEILELMMKERKRVFTAEEIYETIWKEPYFSSANNTIMVHILKLRKKIEYNPKSPKIIKTAWGKGYYVD